MLLRDKIAKKIKENNPELSKKLKKIESNEEFIQELIKKIQFDLNQFKITLKEEDLAELNEGIEFLKLAIGFSSLFNIREKLKEKFGLFWDQMKLED